MYTIAIKEWGLSLTANPVLNIRKPSPGQGRNRRLKNDEEKRLIEACSSHSNPMLGWIVKLALYTAMRKGEITSLTKNQVNVEKRTLFLPDTKNNSVRTVPLTDKALDTIKQALGHLIRPLDTDVLMI